MAEQTTEEKEEVSKKNSKQLNGHFMCDKQQTVE